MNKKFIFLVIVLYILYKNKSFFCPFLNQYICPENDEYEYKVSTKVSYDGGVTFQ